jgi:hypothetical protein
MSKFRLKKATDNRLVCALVYWFYESHHTYPQRVRWVYSPTEYISTNRHVWVERMEFWHTLYRAVGMIFPALAKLWQKLEQKLWPVEKPDEKHWMGF